MAVSTFTKSGAKATTPAKLDKSVFGIEIKNHELIKQAYVAYQAGGRDNLAITKTRGLIRGGGKKPWAQKGTGRARFGSSRNPIWRGGGIVFGPTGEENFIKRINIKAKRQALRQSLSIAATENKVNVIEDFDIKSAKTSELVKLLTKLNAGRNTLIVVEKKTPELLRSSQNLKSVVISSAKFLNVYDILNADQLIFTVDALKETTKWLKAEEKA